MATSTRQAKRDVMHRVFKEILDLEDGSELHRACVHDNVTSLDGLLSFSEKEIMDLTYLDGTTKNTIKKGIQGLVFALQSLSIKRSGEGNRIINDWTNVTQDEYDDYRTSGEYISARTGLPNPSTTRSTYDVPTFVRPRDPLADYRRGVRRDANAFIALKEDKQWDSWERSTVAQARAQDLSDVLDTNYVPSTPEENELFVEKQKFVYAVLEKNLLTDKGKSLIRHYAATFDAQKVYRDISKYAKSSTQAAMEASTLLAYITSANCGDGTWKGSTQSFILNWQDKIRQYELIIPIGDHFSTTIKRTMLENAVGRIPELRAVKNQAAQHKTQNGVIELSYDQYCSLLASAAQEYDGSLIRDLKPPPSAARRSVYFQETYDTENINEDAFFDTYNIDSSPNDTLEANFTGFGGPRLNADQWSRLSKAAQTKWDEFSREEKSILLEQKIQNPPGGKASKAFPRV